MPNEEEEGRVWAQASEQEEEETVAEDEHHDNLAG